MTKIAYYKLVEAWNPEYLKAEKWLVHRVRAMLELGWEPQGGVGITWRPTYRGGQGHFQLVQAMIKREEAVQDEDSKD